MKSKTAFAAAGAALVILSAAGMPTAAAEPTWTMPSLQGMNLEKAQALYTEAVGGNGPTLKYVNKQVASWTIVAPAMWDVCSQSPDPGSEIAPHTVPRVSVNEHGEC